MIRAAGDSLAGVFPGPLSEWTADQVHLVAVTREYADNLRAIHSQGQKPPSMVILSDYAKWRAWLEFYAEHPEARENPYRGYRHGMRD